jgi:transposase InsO family protein
MEFVNESLLLWLREQGIDAQMIAGYSPAQNGAVECLNHTLVELAHAMMIAHPIPVYLWEYALQHAAYVCEWVPMKALLGKTPLRSMAWKETQCSALARIRNTRVYSTARSTAWAQVGTEIQTISFPWL